MKYIVTVSRNGEMLESSNWNSYDSAENYINSIVFAHDSSEIIEQTETRMFKVRELRYHIQEIIVVTIYNDYYTYRIMEAFQ